MSDLVLALVITVLLIAGMVAFVPLLVWAERLLKADVRPVMRELPEERELVPEAGTHAEAA